MDNNCHEECLNDFNKFVKEVGLIEKETRLEKKYFGNLLYIYEYNNIMLKLIRDRGQYFVDVCSKDNIEHWYQLELVLTIIGSKCCKLHIERKESEAEQLQMYIDILRTCLDDIDSLFKQNKREKTETKLDARRLW